MAWHDKVVWTEGMFLRPAHFQQQVRYVEHLVEERCQPLHAHAAGFSHLELDPALLRLGKLAIVQARGVFPDGTPFCIDGGDNAPAALDIPPGDAFQGIVHLSLPVRHRATPELAMSGGMSGGFEGDFAAGSGALSGALSGAATGTFAGAGTGGGTGGASGTGSTSGTGGMGNAGSPNPAGTDRAHALARYRLHEYDAADTHTPGAADVTLQVGRLNLALLPERARHGDVVTLGVARVIERRDDGSVRLDDGYLPPASDCRAVPALTGLIRELQGLLRHRADALAARVSAAGRGGLGEVADFLLLQLANRQEALFSHFAKRGALHPIDLHVAVVQLAAELASFTRAGRRPPEFAPYRHHDLQASFREPMAELRRSLAMVFEQGAVALPLDERKYGIRVGTVADRSLLKSAGFVLAARADLPGDELRRRFPAQAKVGSVEQIRQLVNLQLPGVALRPLPVAPRQLPYHAGFAYFELERSGEAWGALEPSGGFAIHVGGEFPGLELELWAIRE